MSMSITKLVAGTATDYFSTTVYDSLTDHNSGMATYYNAPGTPPGMWMGRGLDLIGKQAGQSATKDEVSQLYDELRNPKDDSKLSHAKPEDITSGKVVGGYDLTFTMPKSVNILWACGDENIRKTIMDCHMQALSESLEWFQDNEAYARVGAGGAMKVRANGVSAVAYHHWDTRDHDPHLHTHLLVSNIVTRPDGTTGALDGRSLYRNAVYISERHTNLLMDKLTERLGVQWRPRENAGTKAAVYDLVGVDDQLIDHFSQRHAEVQRAKRELTAAARRAGTELDKNVIRRIDAEAWNGTRKAKPKQPLSLHELMDQWGSEMNLLGRDPHSIIAQTCGRDWSSLDVDRLMADPHSSDFITRLLDQGIREAPSLPGAHRNAFLKDVEDSATRINESSIRSAAERITRAVRMNQKGRDRLTQAITEREKTRLIELTPARYTIPDEAADDMELSDGKGRAATDHPEGRVYATPQLLDAEQRFKDLSEQQYDPARYWDNGRLEQAIANQQQNAPHPLAADQKQAVKRLLSDRHAITALTGPAGTGKTTTLKVVADLIDEQQGKGHVLGLAPTAAAATELGESLGTSADTLAKILDEDTNNRIGAQLEKTISDYNATPAGKAARRQMLRERATALQAQKTSLTVPEHGVVIVDEAGMADTFSIAHLASMCDERGAKIIMVGDDHQLDTPGGGAGAFSWMVDHRRDVALTSVWRFNDKNEARRSLMLREGKTNKDGESLAIREYDQAGHIHAGTGDDIAEEAVSRLAGDLANGVDSLLIVGDNQELAQLNEHVSRILEQRGLVDGSTRVTLSDGSTAAQGDIICTRRNNRRLSTSQHRWIHNNDLWQIDHIDASGVDCHRKGEPEDTITLPSAYVAEDTVGGYVLTPHRAQGKTVDHGYYLVSQDAHPSSAEMYVAMTRGRESNEAYVASKPVEDMMTGNRPSLELAAWRQMNRAWYDAHGWSEWKANTPCPKNGTWYTQRDLDPTPRQQALKRLDQIAANEQIGRFASEWADNYDRDMHSLKRVGLEHEYYGQVIAQRRLKDRIGEPAVAKHHNEPTWKQMLDAYAEASTIDPDAADAIINKTIEQGSRETRTQLRRQITDHAQHPQWAANHYWRINDPDSLPEDQRGAAKLLNQATDLIEQTIDSRLKEASDPETAPEWVLGLGDIPAPDSPRRTQWESIVAEASAYREARNISDEATMFGGDDEHVRDGWRQRIDHDLASYRTATGAADPDRVGTPSDIGRIPGGKAQAVRYGRPAIIAANGAKPVGDTGNAVIIDSKDPAATLTAIRRIDREAVANATVLQADDQQIEKIWEALTPRERGSVIIDDGLGGHTELWRSMTAIAREQGGTASVQDVVDGLDQRSRRRAVVLLNSEQTPRPKEHDVQGPAGAVQPEVEGPEIGA